MQRTSHSRHTESVAWTCICSLVSIAVLASPPDVACSQEQQLAGSTIVVTLDRGTDIGQAFGSLFEAKTADGSLVMGAGFQNAYNTRYRADRHAIQFFIRPTDGRRELAVEELPRPNDELVGSYIYSQGGHIYSTYGGLKRWNADRHRWDSVRGGEGTSSRGTGETMRVGNGVLAFGDSRVSYNGEVILDPPEKGSYQLFFYAHGYLCFYHVHRGDGPYRPFEDEADGYSRLMACPWTPAQGAVDLRDAIVLRLPVVGETTFAWGQAGDQIVTGSNIGGFYVLHNKAWKMLLEPNLGVSYQLYSSLAFYDRLLMGQYPTGRVFSYDGGKIADQPGWPPVMPGVSDAAREAQTTAIYGGDLLVGVWPWGEVWRYNPDQRQWHFAQRMFPHPQPTTKIIHPYDVENRENSPQNLWGQRVTSLVPHGPDLFIATSAKAPYPWQPERYPFLADGKWKSYGKIFRATMPGHLSAATRWTKGPTQLKFTIGRGRMMIHQDGELIGTSPLPGSLATRIAKAKPLDDIRWKTGIYGEFDGKSLSGEVVSGTTGDLTKP